MKKKDVRFCNFAKIGTENLLEVNDVGFQPIVLEGELVVRGGGEEVALIVSILIGHKRDIVESDRLEHLLVGIEGLERIAGGRALALGDEGIEADALPSEP